MTEASDQVAGLSARYAALRQADSARSGAAPAEDHLVLYETVAVSAELKKAMREVAVAIRPWQGIVDAFDAWERNGR